SGTGPCCGAPIRASLGGRTSRCARTELMRRGTAVAILLLNASPDAHCAVPEATGYACKPGQSCWPTPAEVATTELTSERRTPGGTVVPAALQNRPRERCSRGRDACWEESVRH